MSAHVIDPEVQQFVDEVARSYARYPDVKAIPPAEGRKVIEEVRRPWRQGGPTMHSTEDRKISLAAGTMRVRVYRPSNSSHLPALIYLHGGGFTFFSIDTHDRVMREYAARAGIAVIGVDYPLAPEAKFPFALEQLVELVEWLADHAHELGVDPGRLAIGGDSAGGNLSVASALMLRDKGRGRLLKGMLLNYPGLSPESSAEAARRFGGADSILSASEVDYFWANYVRGPADLKNPLANVLLADAHQLPPALFIVAECDILAEQSPLLANRIRDARGEAAVLSYPGAVHGFIEAVAISQLAAAALQAGADWLDDILAWLPRYSREMAE